MVVVWNFPTQPNVEVNASFLGLQKPVDARRFSRRAKTYPEASMRNLR
jgi:hypothetical protein